MLRDYPYLLIEQNFKLWRIAVQAQIKFRLKMPKSEASPSHRANPYFKR